MPREWDAKTYDQLPLPHEAWGDRTLSRLELSGDETVLDAGSGTGRDTTKLLNRLPSGRVVAADASTAMLDQLRTKIGHDPRVRPFAWDLTTPLPAALGPFDAVFSVATFHWVFDHQRLFNNLAGRMVSSGMLVAECGGQGNVASIDHAVATILGTNRAQRWNFADVDSTTRRLMEAGFEPLDVALRSDPLTLHDADVFRSYLETLVLGSHLDAMDADEGEQFLTAVIASMEKPTIDYVRLEIVARKA